MIAQDYLLTPPDWSQQVKVRRMWRTAVQRSVDGGCSRQGLYSVPHLSMAYRISTISAAETDYIRRRLYASLHQIVGCPLWPDRSDLTAGVSEGHAALSLDTTLRHFEVGAPVILFKSADDYALGVILSLTDDEIILEDDLESDWPAGTTVYPLLQGRLTISSSRVASDTDAHGWIDVDIVEEFDADITHRAETFSGDTYRDLPVMGIAPDWSTPPEQSHDRPATRSDGLWAAYEDPLYDEPTLTAVMAWSAFSRADILELAAFFDEIQGGLNAFWVPTWQSDIRLDAGFAADSTVLSIDGGLPDEWQGNDVIGLHAAIIYPDGTIVCRGIADAGASSITLSAAPGKALATADLPCAMISFLLLVRSAADTLELAYDAEEAAGASMTMETLQAQAISAT